MDVLADVLQVSALGNAILNRSELVAPFGLGVGAEVRAAVHIVQQGTCWLKIGKRKPSRLNSGDIVLIPRGTPHAIVDEPTTAVEPFEQALRKQARRWKQGRASATPSTTLLCAEIKFDQREPHPLMQVLPELIHISALLAEDDHGLAALSRVLVREALGGRMGAELVIPRLIDALLVFIVRHWIEQQPAASAGWLGALRDEHIGRALAFIHEAPERGWTVDELASKVRMSRPTFARRFSALVGEPPHAYVTRWRMNLAARLLRSSSDSAEQIAARVGYDSPTAFGAAFRRHLGTSPGRYRKREWRETER